MVQRIVDILTRFPENEAAIRKLVEGNPDFDALCHEYASTSKELDELAKLMGPDVAIQAGALRNRRRVVEEEILTMIEGYRPA
jgi:hypothetical protein